MHSCFELALFPALDLQPGCRLLCAPFLVYFVLAQVYASALVSILPFSFLFLNLEYFPLRSLSPTGTVPVDFLSPPVRLLLRYYASCEFEQFLLLGYRVLRLSTLLTVTSHLLLVVQLF